MIKHLHGLSIKVKYILLLSTKKNKNKTSLINVQFDSEANDFEQLVKSTFFFFCLYLLGFQNRVSLCSPHCVGTHSVDQTSLKPRPD